MHSLTSLHHRATSGRPGPPPCSVVVVDDDRFFLRLISGELESAGFETRCFLEPEKALASIEEQAPTVILADYRMPQMNGVTFLKRARALAPRAERILCTAAQTFEVAQEALNSGGVCRLLSKSSLWREMLNVVRQADDEARARRENEGLQERVRQQNDQLMVMNARLEEMVRDRTQALLDGLIAALDYRDNDTQWHSRRVSAYARRLAIELGISGPELSTIEHGALLHDIGKIGVRDCILLKPGPLSPDEWEEMKRHAAMGWALLQRVEYLRPASVIVHQHQEKWDGSGYPHGLKGEQIVLGARIFHVVDALDAITSDRPYRRARRFADAKIEIERCRGSHFDPRVVEAFLAASEQEWERIRLDFDAVARPFSEFEERPPGVERPAEARARRPGAMARAAAEDARDGARESGP